MRKTFVDEIPGTAKYVVEHGRYMISRGRNPSAAFMDIPDKRRAFAFAQSMLSAIPIPPPPANMIAVEYEVVQGGWLWLAGRNELSGYKRDLIEKLNASLRGDFSRDGDESRFARVDPQLVGMRITIHSRDRVVFPPGDTITGYLANGQQVKIKMLRALSTEAQNKWADARQRKEEKRRAAIATATATAIAAQVDEEADESAEPGEDDAIASDPTRIMEGARTGYIGESKDPQAQKPRTPTRSGTRTRKQKPDANKGPRVHKSKAKSAETALQA